MPRRIVKKYSVLRTNNQLEIVEAEWIEVGISGSLEFYGSQESPGSDEPISALAAGEWKSVYEDKIDAPTRRRDDIPQPDGIKEIRAEIDRRLREESHER